MEKFDKLQELQELFKQLIKNEFTGSVTINFSQGGIGRIEKLEVIRISK